VNALLREMQLMMGQGAPAATASIVEMVQGSWTTAGGTGDIPFTNAVQAGDRVVILASRSSGLNSVTLAATDNNATVYTQEAYPVGVANSSVAVFLSGPQVAKSGFTVNVDPSGGSGGGVRAYLLRGMPGIALDSAHVNANATGSAAIVAGATYDMGAYATSGRAFVAAVVNAYQANSPTAPCTFSADTALIDDASGIGHGAGGHSELFGHALVSAAVSGQAFKVVASTSSTGKASAAWALIPFTY
jgi:hypothetical protein